MLASRKLPSLAVIFLLALTACAPASLSSTQSPTPGDTIPTTGITAMPTLSPVPETPKLRVTQMPEKFPPVIGVLAASYGLSSNEIALVSIEAMDWSNSCLGIERPGIACLDVITPGYRLIFTTPKGEIEVHTNLDASVFYIVPSGSGIKGQALVTSACPGPVQPGKVCPNQPYLGIIQVTDQTGNIFAEISTAEDGSFQVDLPPGDYLLTLPPGNKHPIATSLSFSVVPGEYNQVQFLIDSGMR